MRSAALPRMQALDGLGALCAKRKSVAVASFGGDTDIDAAFRHTKITTSGLR
jgi:hypothetical protein